MSDSIVFIDDVVSARKAYERRLKRMFGSEYTIVCPEVIRNIDSMLSELDVIKDKVAYFIDENLVHTGIADYMGTDLIERLRVNDPDIPIYILTSDLSQVDQQLGDIEFAIDKTKWSNEHEKYAQRFLRHISTFRRIKTEQAQRFDELFLKSLSEPLSEDEKEEYDELNVIRSKTLINEAVISKESVHKLNRQSAELEELYTKLKVLSEGKGDE